MRSAVAAMMAVLALSACHRTPQPRVDFRAATSEEQKVAIEAVEKFRAAFQDGSCLTIYDQASEAFRKLERQEDWERVCGELHGELTVYLSDQSFEVAENIVYVDIQ